MECQCTQIVRVKRNFWQRMVYKSIHRCTQCGRVFKL